MYVFDGEFERGKPVSWRTGQATGRAGQATKAAMRRIRVLVIILAAVFALLYGVWRLSNSRTLQLLGEIVPRVSTAEKVVALTFDDGPTQEATDQILSLLGERGVKATFFLTGAELEQNPELGRKIAGLGHEIGNHSYSHKRMIFKTPSFVSDEIERTDRLIKETGYEGAIHFRPPYGKKLLVLPYYLSKTARKTIMWDVEPDSYPEIAEDSDKIVNHVLERVRPGSIILLHVMYKSREQSMRAVPRIIDGLKAGGYQFKTVSELLSTTAPGGESAQPQGAIFNRVPDQINTGSKYVIYLHGRIVEEKGLRPTDSRYGTYEYQQILDALKSRSLVVISEARAAGTDVGQYAAKVADQVRALLKAGVPARSITVVGASKGSVIAMLASTRLREKNVNFVLMGNCNDSILENHKIDLWGNILSIYDSSDEFGQTCKKFFEKATGLGERKEIELKTGLGHGFLYRPMKEWIEPAVEWASQR
jgi:peptidoglycan-N-acetylglucosamine deacetylase